MDASFPVPAREPARRILAKIQHAFHEKNSLNQGINRIQSWHHDNVLFLSVYLSPSLPSSLLLWGIPSKPLSPPSLPFLFSWMRHQLGVQLLREIPDQQHRERDDLPRFQRGELPEELHGSGFHPPDPIVPAKRRQLGRERGDGEREGAGGGRRRNTYEGDSSTSTRIWRSWAMTQRMLRWTP